MKDSMEKNTNEEWRCIPGYDSRYMVSNLGRMKSTKVRRAMHGEIVDIPREKIMNPTDNGNGYLIVRVTDDQGRRRKIYVHRAVAEAFIPRIPGKEDINHKDYNKRNNRVDNLEWCTPLENVRYSSSRMHVMHSSPLPSTGEKYITFRNRKGKWRYRVQIDWAHTDRSFETLEEAINYRNEIVGDIA